MRFGGGGLGSGNERTSNVQEVGLLGGFGVTICLFSGCDQKEVGQAEVVVGKGMQIGGEQMVVRIPHATGKAAGGAAVYAGGVAIEEDGKGRISRAEQKAE